MNIVDQIAIDKIEVSIRKAIELKELINDTSDYIEHIGDEHSDITESIRCVVPTHIDEVIDALCKNRSEYSDRMTCE